MRCATAGPRSHENNVRIGLDIAGRIFGIGRNHYAPTGIVERRLPLRKAGVNRLGFLAAHKHPAYHARRRSASTHDEPTVFAPTGIGDHSCPRRVVYATFPIGDSLAEKSPRHPLLASL